MLADRQACLPRIHKVRMENFLSFSNQEVELDAQFSVIVGPNGAGKSSIFQAVKFALGSNDKDSRYPRWSDFIRFKEQYARVELCIIRGADSYGIRRTVFQNGKLTYETKVPGVSEYSIVPKNVIDDLVGNLGYSTDNIFAFVSQGKIDAIKNMDPHGLCAYLEEGLGLLPVRQKIAHEHDRLQRLQQDMAELGQRKNTYEVELEFLQPKLERLARKREIMASLAALKEELMIANRQKTINEIETLKEEKNQNNEVLSKVDAKLAEAHEQEEKFDAQVTAIEADLNGLYEQAGRKKGDLAIIDGEIKSWEREKQEKIDALRAIDDELKEKQANLAQKEQIEQRIKEKLDNTSKVVEELRAKQAAIVAERERIGEVLKQYAEWRAKYTRTKEELEQKQQEVAELANKIMSLASQSAKLLEQIKHANHQCDHIYKILDKWGANFEQNYQSHRTKLRQDIFDQESTIQDLKLRKNKYLEELSRYERIMAGKDSVYPPTVRQMKAEIKKRNWRVKGPLLEIMQFDPVYAAAIESLFGKAALYSFIVPNRETFVLMTQLRKNLHAFCKIFLPKSESIMQFPPLPKQEGVVGYLFDLIKAGGDEEVRKVLRTIVGDAIVVERTSVGLDLHNAGVKARCVTLDGEILIAHKLAEESRPSKDLRAHVSYQQCRMKVEQCRAQIEDLDEEIESETTTLQDLKDKFARFEKFGQLLPKLQELSKEKEELSTENHSINAQKVKLEGQQETTKQSIAALEQEIQTMQQDVGIDVIRMQEREKQLPVEIEECLNNLSGLLKVKDATADYYQVAFQAATGARAEFENCQARKQQISEQVEKSDNQILASFRELRKTEKDIARVERQIEEGRNRKALILQEKKGCEEVYFNLKIESDRVHAEIQRLEDMITEREQGLRKIMEQLANKPLEDQVPARPVEEIEEDIAHITENYAEYYDVDDHVETRRDEIMESIKRVQSHRGQVEEEIQAAEKVSEALRTEFYSKLSAELAELETRMNERFHNNAVNYRVGLQLGGEFSNLEVKITASALANPLTPITALSGGQRTMVAINLVLCLQSFNPSPIIIFDEAEMFLDKKNSAVVSKLVGETTSNGVQIIMLMPDSSKGLITLANRVIGVALAGPNGPSTIVPDPHLLNISPPEE